LQYVKENPDFPLRRFVKHENGETLTGVVTRKKKESIPIIDSLKQPVIPKEIFEDAFKSFADQFQLKESICTTFTIR